MVGLEFPTRRPEIPMVRVQSERLLAGDRTELSKTSSSTSTGDERWVARAGQLIDLCGTTRPIELFDPYRIVTNKSVHAELGPRAVGHRSRRPSIAATGSPAAGASGCGGRLQRWDPWGAVRRRGRRGGRQPPRRRVRTGCGAFNHGVRPEQRGDVEGAKAAYHRAMQSGDPENVWRSSKRSARIHG